jgi:invasion protein IalB
MIDRFIRRLSVIVFLTAALGIFQMALAAPKKAPAASPDPAPVADNAAAPAPSAPAAASVPADGQPEPLWTKDCAKTGNSAEVCFVQQFAISKQLNAIVLHVQIGYFAPFPETRPRMLITTPLGIILPPGISMTLDGDKPLVLPVETCQKEGCLVTAVLDQNVLGRFLKGKILMVRYIDSQRQAVDIPLRLDGLGQALKNLDKTTR